jgi:N-acetylneuraminate lyase
MSSYGDLIAATFTPFHADGTLNLKKIPELVEHLCRDGLKGVFICGTNGEGPNMTVHERMLVAEAYMSAVRGRLRVVVHVGHTSIAEARTLAAHAAAIGADACSAVAGFYFKPASAGNLVDCMADIAAGAPELPFYYYHIPHLTGVAIDVDDFLKTAGDRIPNLAGVKYTATTLHEFQSLTRRWRDQYDILFGLDELMLPALSVGAGTFIGSTYTFAAPLYQQTLELFKYGNLEAAQEQHAYLVEMIRILLKYPPIPAQKCIMQMMGIDLGPSRLPLINLTQPQVTALRRSLEEIDFFERVAAAKRQVTNY